MLHKPLFVEGFVVGLDSLLVCAVETKKWSQYGPFCQLSGYYGKVSVTVDFPSKI